MTRERFIKLLMAHGKRRNEATKIALRYNNRNYSYKNAYSEYLIKYVVSDAFNKLGQSFSKTSKAIVELSNAFSKLKTT